MHQRLTNSSAKPASGPECSVPATGCAGMKSTGRRQMRRHVLQHRGLDRADIRDDRAGLQVRRDVLRDRAASADRHAGDDEIGVLHGVGIGLGDAVRQAESPWRACRTSAEPSVATSSPASPSASRAAGDRRADQPEADDGDARKQRRVVHLSTQKVAQGRDDEPVGLFGADRQPQRMRKLVVLQCRAARGRAWSGTHRRRRRCGPSPAGSGSGRSSQRSASPSVRACRSPRSASRSHCSLCARARSR